MVMSMGDITNITERLKNLVIQRKTPIVINERVVGRKAHHSSHGSYSGDTSSFSIDE